MPRKVAEILECDLCGSTTGVETATLRIEGDLLELLLCAEDRKKVSRVWRAKGRLIAAQRSSPEGHKVEPFEWKPGE
jgi:hypothetical protein